MTSDREAGIWYLVSGIWYLGDEDFKLKRQNSRPEDDQPMAEKIKVKSQKLGNVI